MSGSQDDFFVGWSGRTGRPLAIFLGIAATVGVCGFLALAAILSGSTDDPGPGTFDIADGEQVLQGILTIDPYPLLHLSRDAAHPQGHTLLLSGDGKRGPSLPAGTMAGQVVSVKGYLLKRGTIDMMMVDDLTPLPSPGDAVAPAQRLGRWRIVGEICDGKCYSGGMRPGAGLAHKACANLCLIGEVPPVFVSTMPVAGATFLLLTDQDGNRMPDAIRDYVAVRVRLEGELERRGDMLVLKVDIARMAIL
jgi:hypothetical protein